MPSSATEGDTEAVVAAYHHWGPDAVARLRGMFAFLIWDRERGELYGARDPFGIKPLFTMEGPGWAAFASEKKCLLDLAADTSPALSLDLPALQHYLLLQYVPEPASMHREIRRIESGTHFTARPGAELETRRYFRPTFTARPVRGAAERSRLHERIGEVLARLGRQAHAGGRDGRRVPVRRDRLHRDRRAGQASTTRT